MNIFIKTNSKVGKGSTDKSSEFKKTYYEILKANELFKNIPQAGLGALLQDLDIKIKTHQKNEVILAEGESSCDIGIILAGWINAVKTDADGNNNIILKIQTGHAFGEPITPGKKQKSPVSLVAAPFCTAAYIKTEKLFSLTLCQEYKNILTENLLSYAADKNALLYIKNDILAQKSIRKRVLAFFNYQYNFLEQGEGRAAKSVELPFSREELADFLCVNSNALSRELGKMRDEGMIVFYKNQFILSPQQ